MALLRARNGTAPDGMIAAITLVNNGRWYPHIGTSTTRTRIDLSWFLASSFAIV